MEVKFKFQKNDLTYVELTENEARKLWAELDKFFNKQVISIPYSPNPAIIPLHNPQQQWYSTQEPVPPWTITSSNETKL